MYLEQLKTGDFPLPSPCVAIVPVGTIEAHGRHLPLGTDNIIPAEIIARIERQFTRSVLVTPLIPFGHTYYLEDWPGSLNVPTGTLKAYVLAVCGELVRNGCSRFLFINGHGGNCGVLADVCEELSYRGATSAVCSWWEDLADDIAAIAPHTGHAGEDETSLVLASDSSLVDMSRATAGPDWPDGVPLSLAARRAMFPDGMTGDARAATPDKGNKIYDLIHTYTAGLVAQLIGE